MSVYCTVVLLAMYMYPFNHNLVNIASVGYGQQKPSDYECLDVNNIAQADSSEQRNSLMRVLWNDLEGSEFINQLPLQSQAIAKVVTHHTTMAIQRNKRLGVLGPKVEMEPALHVSVLGQARQADRVSSVSCVLSFTSFFRLHLNAWSDAGMFDSYCL